MTENDKPKRWIGCVTILLVWIASVLLDVQFSYGFVGFHSIIVLWLLLSALTTIVGAVWYAFQRRARLFLLGLVSLALTICEIKVGSAVSELKIDQSYVAAVPLISALDAYRRDHGNPPENLDELIPAYISAIPTTKMKWFGTPFGYSVEEAEYQLSFETPLFMRATYSSTDRRWISHD